ncbi:serine hydrolase [Streptomyces sp. SID3343]|uniref:serine hydrolase n=1 Tax=Streptomyces sp. SID3343 TaxID=2690260 RepID=UPI001370DD01|nr:serine hydrolase [Streptomyces sp. SID3343]MYW05879.1 serine hydrolase [Streptomyces sp. SID3343]
MTSAPVRTDVGAVEDRLRAVFEAAGTEGFLYVRDVDDDDEFTFQGDSRVVLASVFKIQIALEYARQVAAGKLDRASRHVLGDAFKEGTGIGTDSFAYDVELSVRDAAQLMMTMSDNAATDLVLGIVGRENVRATLDELGFQSTGVTGCRELFDQVAQELGLDRDSDLDRLGADITLEQIRALSVRDPGHAATSTPREMANLLTAIWRDEAGPAEACAEVRDLMGRQIWPHRLSSAFEDEIRISAKTGTLWGVRNEAGVVEYPDGKRYAVAVFLRPESMGFRLPAVDAAIGRAAREVIDHLRS